MKQQTLNPEIVSYLSRKLGLSEKTISKNISLLRRDYGRYSSNIVAHLYARKNNLSVLQKLSKEDKQNLPEIEIISSLRANPRKKNKQKVVEIEPSRKYGNSLKLKKILRGCSDRIWWIDKHFTQVGLEYIYENMDKTKIKEVKILLSINSNIDFDKFKKEFDKFSSDVAIDNVKAECKIICSKEIVNLIHGRFIITKDKTFSVPPINSLLMGQYDQIQDNALLPPFETWWNSAKDLLRDFQEIKNLKKMEDINKK